MRELFLDKGLLRLQALQNRFTQSLFFLPALMVLASIVLSQLTAAADRSIGGGVLPGFFQTTVESSRSILGAIAGGTITSASIVFSLTLVAVQLAASQFSPRVLEGFLRDRFQQIVMGTVVGTFSFSLLTLREVSDKAGDTSAFIPQLSIAVALLLALASLLAVLASIDHTAKGLRVGTVIDRVMNETIAVVEAEFECSEGPFSMQADDPGQVASPGSLDPSPGAMEPPSHARAIMAPVTGWVTGLKSDQLVDDLPDGATAMVMATVGSWIVVGTPAIFVWPCTDGEYDIVVERLDEVIRIEPERTLQQDVGFGLLQLSDVGLKALSPGVNDPNTAIEVLSRIGAVMISLNRREIGPASVIRNGRTVLRPTEPALAEYVDSAFEPIRRYARTDHKVLAALARTVFSVIEDGRRRGDVREEGALWAQLELMKSEIDLLPTEADRIALRTAIDPLLAAR